MSTPRRFQRLNAVDVPAWLAQHPHALLLDAREARHHAQGHMKGSVRLDGRNHEGMLMREDKARPVFIYCYHGHASQTYAEMFADFGFATVVDLIGGWEAWRAQQAAAESAPHAEPVDAHGNTPLMQAAWRGQVDVVQTLLAQGSDLGAINGDGNNALWMACVSNDPVLVIMLAQAGVPIDHVNATGATCLMYAASSGKPEIVRVLLALGADPLIQTQDDFTALDMAASLDCLQLLRVATRSATRVPAKAEA